jgi:hypothetical protein
VIASPLAGSIPMNVLLAPKAPPVQTASTVPNSTGKFVA